MIDARKRGRAPSTDPVRGGMKSIWGRAFRQVEEAKHRGRMARVLRPAAQEEGAVADEAAPALARGGAAEQGGDVGGGHAVEDLEHDVVREEEERGHRFFHRRAVIRTYMGRTSDSTRALVLWHVCTRVVWYDRPYM